MAVQKLGDRPQRLGQSHLEREMAEEHVPVVLGDRRLWILHQGSQALRRVGILQREAIGADRLVDLRHRVAQKARNRLHDLRRQQVLGDQDSLALEHRLGALDLTGLDRQVLEINHPHVQGDVATYRISGAGCNTNPGDIAKGSYCFR